MEDQIQLGSIETPAVLLDLAKLVDNLQSMQQLADQHGVALRPHAKTHKSIEIAERQLALGAVGLTVATVGEALVFQNSGIRSITISRPMVSPGSFDRLIQAPAARDTDLRITVDSQRGIEIAAAKADLRLGVFIKVDVGLHRCGVDPDGPAAIELAQQIAAAPNLDFRGILSHAGQGYSAQSRLEAGEIAEAERKTMLQVRDRLVERGIAVAEVSVGATPTVLATTDFSGITEIRPGNYAFLDLLPIKVGVVENRQVSLSVLATVISKNADFFITDAGSKTLTSDIGVHGMASTQGYGIAYPSEHYLEPDYEVVVAGLSEEHGKLIRGDFDLPIGAQVRIIPNHSCPVANLARNYVVLDENRQQTWPIDAAANAH